MGKKLTKKQEAALHVALSIDDLLYAKFETLNRDLNERIQRYYKNPRKVLGVIQKKKDGTLIKLQILDVQVVDMGTLITVGES